jgi:acetyltransferase-like isoleucine patch superfamily enzyme
MQKLYKKIFRRIMLYLLRINKFIFFSNSLRMFIYRKILSIPIGKKSIIWCGNRFNDVSELEIGENVIIGPSNVFLIRGGLVIGNNVNLSGFSFFISQEHDVNDPFGHTTLSKIVIEDDVWIATNSTILPGVRVGRGAVIAAGSLVTKDVPAYTVVAGNPAKPIMKRTNDILYRLDDIHGLKWL